VVHRGALARRAEIGEALELAEADLDVGRGSLLVRSGKGRKRREAHPRRSLAPGVD
jgi:hypothetical protein